MIDKSGKPALDVQPAAFTQGAVFRVTGTNWPLDAIVLTIGGEPRKPDRVISGSLWDGLVVPAEDGSFVIEYSTDTLTPGSIAIRAAVRGARIAANAKIEVRERREGPKVPRAELDKAGMRGLAFKRERARNGRWHQGFTLAMREDWLRKYGPGIQQLDGTVFFSAPVHGLCNWVPLGPAPFTHGQSASAANNTGRTRCIAIDPSTPSLMYIGTASGGLWRSADAGETWEPRTDDKFSLAVGAIAVDPVSPNIVYAGTGEYVPGSDYGAYYGRGLLKSTNLGDTWSEIGVTDFDMAEIARIVVNPANNANLFVAASNGLWESTSSGATWTRLTPDGCTDVVLVQNPAEPGTRRLIAGFASIGVRQSANSGGGWSAFTDVTVMGAPANSRRIVFGVCRTQPRTMYAAFCGGTGGAGSLAHVARSDDWGQNWTARTIPSSTRIWAAYYNLAVQPHPANPEILFLGVVDVFKSIDGGGSWTSVSGAGGDSVHSDVHSIVWHPTDPNRVYVTCDGGVFMTPDLGATWEAINLDVAAIQLYDFGQHPQYEAIMIAGSQDNGGFHYSGAPVWKKHWVAAGVTHNRMDSDGTTATIDPFNGYVHYYGTGVVGSISRSDSAGRLFDAATWSYFPGTQWWSPFYCHPLSAGVVFTGGNRVWRSDARGNAGTWTDITANLAAPMRSMGFHPSNPRVVYVGTTGGHVYRLTGPAAGAWTSATVTTDDVTLTGLPAGIGISSIAVDTSGNVWITSSDIIRTEATGEFSSDHVFRLDAGATAWASRSAGLVVANPINTIVIDPDSSRVFCGGDRGVFEWSASASAWTLLDQGLPNAPIVELMVHSPSRKLRAATYGRGMWERSLAGGCTDYFLYLRDNLVDSGRTPSPDHVPHPYIPGELCRHWQSQDIVVDPVAQTPSLVTSAMELFDKVRHMGARRGGNRIYVTAHNKGPFAVTGVRVRAFFAPASMGLPPLPAGLLADPFGWNPAGPSDWTPVSTAAFPIARIEPGTTRLASWNFTIPSSAPRHSCLLTFVTSNEDPFATGGITNPDELVVNNRKVALRNLDLDAMPGGGSGGGSGTDGGGLPAGYVARELKMYGHDVARAVIFAANLPEDAVFVVAADRESRKAFRAEEAKISRRAEKVREKLAKACGKELRGYDFDRAIVREAKRGAEIELGEARLEHGRPVTLFVAVHSAKWDREQPCSFDVLQMSGDKVVGGYTVQLADLP